MKKIYLALAAVMVAGASFGQTNSTKTNTDSSANTTDTIKVGNFIIIKKNRDYGHNGKSVTIERKPYTPARITTNWFIFDLGFANINDRTDYASAEAQNFLHAVGP